MFSLRRFGRSAGGGLRRALIAGAGMMAWRWWKNRQAAERNRGVGQGDPDLRRTYDADRSDPSGGSY
jgi:hypothetical protein